MPKQMPSVKPYSTIEGFVLALIICISNEYLTHELDDLAGYIVSKISFLQEIFDSECDVLRG